MLETIKQVIDNPEKIIYGLERKGLLDWLNDRIYLKIIYRLIFRRKLHLDQPVTFTEKISWYKLYWRNHLAHTCTDKYCVRDYIAKKIGMKYLCECYGCWDNFDDIDFSKLPDQFVLKATNGSGNVVICRDKNTFDYENARRTLNLYRKRHFSSKTKEWTYYNLPNKIIAERFITREDNSAIYDYKFFCFNGKPEFLLVGSDRDTDVKFTYFDMDWNYIPVKCGHGNNPNIQRPVHFDEMVEVAKKLSEDFPHVRVDLYDEGGRVYFGELTFYHYGGTTRFEPDEWDFKFGQYFNLIDIPKDQKIMNS